MENVLFGIIGIGLLVGLYFVRNAFNKTMNQKVYSRGTHKKQKELMIDKPMVFTVPKSTEEVKQVLRDYVPVKPFEELNFLRGGLHIIGDIPEGIVWGYGNKTSKTMGYTFIASATLNETSTGATEVIFQFDEWMESDGVAGGVNEMEQLKNNVITIMDSLDSFEFDDSTDTQGDEATAEEFVLQAEDESSAAAVVTDDEDEDAAACLHCGKEVVLEGDNFCIKCGKDLKEMPEGIEAQPIKKSKFCTKCGRKLEIGQVFCDGCGRQMQTT